MKKRKTNKWRKKNSHFAFDFFDINPLTTTYVEIVLPALCTTSYTLYLCMSVRKCVYVDYYYTHTHKHDDKQRFFYGFSNYYHRLTLFLFFYFCSVSEYSLLLLYEAAFHSEKKERKNQEKIDCTQVSRATQIILNVCVCVSILQVIVLTTFAGIVNIWLKLF